MFQFREICNLVEAHSASVFQRSVRDGGLTGSVGSEPLTDFLFFFFKLYYLSAVFSAAEQEESPTRSSEIQLISSLTRDDGAPVKREKLKFGLQGFCLFETTRHFTGADAQRANHQPRQ